ncbi:Sorbitol-6-phosphate 2-dehydrogenase [Propionispora sp. 2/2-37]|uniref:SDR family oxidoreductase n=1 Tax=Propionispora sp. 2/2-37 TaxID=1677858 RepID=UPI0006BB633B|nr:SDR family oxidoreductase [Propionispora sp. 2/2-37]CUH95207.1 Sorbitol-6-phosphate 2-dehydrogenase [Propionispora sp. 2/2-37]
MISNWIDLKDKVIIVTGGSMGIGSRIAENLIVNGARVVIADLASTDKFVNNDNVLFVECNVTKKADVEKMVNVVVEKYGKIDGLVNNAGVNRARLLVDYYNGDKRHELSEEDFDFMVNVNQKGVFLCTQAVARVMIPQRNGVIINISSEAGMEGSKGQSVYSATKGAVNSFTLSWAKELGQFNIRVVGVAPGINEPTPMGNLKHVEDLAYTRGIKASNVSGDYAKVIPLGRVGKLDEIADLVSYLNSEHSSYITGTIMNITGGKSRG